MKRSEELATLSREHHVALEVALRLRRVTQRDAVAVRERTLDFWENEGREHFHVEEDVLLPALARHVAADDPDIVLVLVQHADLRRRMTALAAEATPAPSALHELGTLLEEHVRHEERTLFPRVEAALPAAEFEALGVRLAAAGAHHRPPRA